MKLAKPAFAALLDVDPVGIGSESSGKRFFGRDYVGDKTTARIH